MKPYFALLLPLVLIYRYGHASVDPNATKDPLFAPDHPNITYLTDKNWDKIVTTSSIPWIIDFYHPFCPHCRLFVPIYVEVAAYQKDRGKVNVGAISCLDHVKCRKFGITGFPTLIFLNFNLTQPGENSRFIGTHTASEVNQMVEAAFANFTQTNLTSTPNSSRMEVKPAEVKLKEIWEESTRPMSFTTRIQDAASAFVFGLKQGIFMGREYLDDMQLDALKEWLRVVSLTFPGSINRLVIANLYEQVKSTAFLDFDSWDAILNQWQNQSTGVFGEGMGKLNLTNQELPEWQGLDNLFLGQGVTYKACALYTCGQWSMFHMMTMNPVEEKRDDALLVSIVTSIRRFVKHFFGCAECRDHFLAYNTLKLVSEIAKAEDKPKTVMNWLWEMHNAVNKRVRHPIWPKVTECPKCGTEGKWDDAEVKIYLKQVYAFEEVRPKIEEKGSGPWKPKDAEMGINNPANTFVDKAGDPKFGIVSSVSSPTLLRVKTTSTAEGVPGSTIYGWYFIPMCGVGIYWLIIRPRSRRPATYSHLPAATRNAE